jgi:hypothetical protein
MVPGARLARRVYSSSAFRWWREQSTSVESQSKGKDMQLTIERAYELVTSHGVFARAYWDRCGGIGYVATDLQNLPSILSRRASPR